MPMLCITAIFIKDNITITTAASIHSPSLRSIKDH